MLRVFKAIVISVAMLFCAQGVQAATMPSPDQSFGILTSGDHSLSQALPNGDPNVLWFEFILSSASLVNLTTAGSPPGTPEKPNDTEIALYAFSGTLLGENDDCNPGTVTSCLQFPSLDAGTYLAAVSAWDATFADMWEVPSSGASDQVVTLTVTARALSPVPVPAAVWLFGTALIGFVGMSRRTSVKS